MPNLTGKTTEIVFSERLPVMAAVAVRKKVVSIGHFSLSLVNEILLDQIKSNCMY